MPGSKSENPKIHFEAGMKDFIRVDKVRLINILGSIQYGILYSVAYFIIGTLIHIIFPPFTKNIQLTVLFGWIILQCLVLIITTFYTRKFIEAIPGLISYFPGYFNFDMLKAKGFIPYGVDEFRGDLTSSIILIGTQYVLLEKVAWLTQEVKRIYF